MLRQNCAQTEIDANLRRAFCAQDAQDEQDALPDVFTRLLAQLDEDGAAGTLNDKRVHGARLAGAGSKGADSAGADSGAALPTDAGAADRAPNPAHEPTSQDDPDRPSTLFARVRNLFRTR